MTANEADDKYLAEEPVSGSTHRFPITNSDDSDREYCIKNVKINGTELVQTYIISFVMVLGEYID